MQKIFVSYSRKDIDFVRKLAGDLESAGYDVWWDITDLRGGDDWVSTIPQAISSSQHVIVVLTPASTESEWVRKEYTQALALRRKIIPIMFEACTVPFALNTINFINFTNGEYADNFERLLSSLGFTDEPPKVAPYKKPILLLPPAFIKYGIPGLIGLILILIFAWTDPFTPPPTPTFTPTLTLTATSTFTSTYTSTSTSTDTATPTRTPSLTPTDVTTASPTRTPQGIRLQICITAESGNIYVRSGPGQTYEPKILDVRDESGQVACPWFSARIENEGYFWLLLAPGQIESLREYEGGWIRRDLLDRESAVDILPAVTLTPTPTASSTPTITPSPTATNTLTPTATIADFPTQTAAP
jgi:hypothetical protein